MKRLQSAFKSMKLDTKTRLSLAIYKYFTAPLIAGLIFLIDFLFIIFDKMTGNEAVSMTDKELLQECKDDMELLKLENVPDNLKDIFPLAKKWGIGDDAFRDDLTTAASEAEKSELISALNGKLVYINQWLDSFSGEKIMTNEAAAFMYLAEAVDEMDLEVRYE